MFAALYLSEGAPTGRALFGGGALYVASRLGDRVVVLGLVGVIWASSLALILSSTPPPAPRGEQARLRAFAESLRAALGSRATWLGLLFGALGGAGFEAVGAVAGPFLIDRGQSSAAVGTFLGLPAVACMLVGALAGGWLSDRGSRVASVALAGVSVSAAVLALAAADGLLSASAPWLLKPLLSSVYLGVGAFTAASYALFMELSDSRLGATQFSAFMGATNLCEAGATRLVGVLAVGLGYPRAFAIMAGVSLASLPILFALRSRGRSGPVE